MSTSNKATKQIIETIVKDYAAACPDEFSQFKKAMKVKQEDSLNDFAETQHMDFIVRKLYEIPETLYVALKARLDFDDYQWLSSKEGGRWFATRFTAFRSSRRT